MFSLGIKCLEAHTHCLRRLLKVKWQANGARVSIESPSEREHLHLISASPFGVRDRATTLSRLSTISASMSVYQFMCVLLSAKDIEIRRKKANGNELIRVIKRRSIDGGKGVDSRRSERIENVFSFSGSILRYHAVFSSPRRLVRLFPFRPRTLPTNFSRWMHLLAGSKPQRRKSNGTRFASEFEFSCSSD